MRAITCTTINIFTVRGASFLLISAFFNYCEQHCGHNAITIVGLTVLLFYYCHYNCLQFLLNT